MHLNGGGRIIGLDIMRVSLALLIFLFHSQMHFGCNYYFLNDFVRMGAIAMTGFFMLSGYSLHLSSSKKDLTKISEIRVFYLKRLITILPLYYSVALIHVVYAMINGRISLADVAVLFPVELFATQSTFTTLFPYSHNSGTWFISCIIICYLLYPFVQSVLLQISNKLRIFLLVVFGGLLLYAPFIQHYFHLDSVSIYTSPFYRLLEFTIGVIIAQMNTTQDNIKLLNRFRKPYSLVLAILLLFVIVTAGRRYGLPTDYMLFNIIALPCFSIIIISLGSMKFENIKGSRLLLYLSSISFTFFLCQILPLWVISKYLYGLLSYESNGLRIILSFTICLIGAVLIHHVIEKPVSGYLKAKLL